MKFIHLFLKYWLKIRIYWSNLLIKNNYTSDVPVNEKLANPKAINIFANKLYKHFTYRFDDIAQMFDAMRSPQACFKGYLDGKLIDDCDGFHAALYHAATKNNFDCYLLTRMSEKIEQSHTTLVVKYYNVYYLFDYTKLFSVYSADEIIKAADLMNNSKTKSYNFVKYDYKLNKYYEVKL